MAISSRPPRPLAVHGANGGLEAVAPRAIAPFVRASHNSHNYENLVGALARKDPATAVTNFSLEKMKAIVAVSRPPPPRQRPLPRVRNRPKWPGKPPAGAPRPLPPIVAIMAGPHDSGDGTRSAAPVATPRPRNLQPVTRLTGLPRKGGGEGLPHRAAVGSGSIECEAGEAPPS